MNLPHEIVPGPGGKPAHKTVRDILMNLRIIALAAGGGVGCAVLGLPAPWLTGAMLASAIGVSALRWQVPAKPVVDSALLLCGLLLGSTATPEALAAAARYPASLGIMILSVIAIVLATGGYLVAVARWPRQDALLAAVPGALSAVLAVAYERGIPVPRIAIVQLFRLFALVAALPSIVVLSGIAPSDLRPAQAATASPQGLLLLGVAGVAATILFERAKITAPVILGATLASAVMHGTGWVQGTLPEPIAIVAFVLLGAGVGGRFQGVTPRALMAAMPTAFIAFFISMAMAMLFAWPASRLAGVSYATALVAFAPGGLEAMAVLAFTLGLDPLYVGAHHLLRFMAVGIGLPVALRIISRRG